MKISWLATLNMIYFIFYCFLMWQKLYRVNYFFNWFLIFSSHYYWLLFLSHHLLISIYFHHFYSFLILNQFQVIILFCILFFIIISLSLILLFIFENLCFYWKHCSTIFYDLGFLILYFNWMDFTNLIYFFNFSIPSFILMIRSMVCAQIFYFRLFELDFFNQIFAR